MKSKNFKIMTELAGYEETDKRLSFVVAAYFVIQIGNAALKTCFSDMSTGLWSILSSVFMVILVIMMAAMVVPVLKRRGVIFFLLEFAIGILFLLSYAMGYASSSDLIQNAFWVLGVSVPIAIYAFAVINSDILLRALTKASYCIVVVDILCCPFVFKNSSYSMTLAMLSLPFVFLLINQAIGTKKPIDVIAAVAGCLFLLIAGNRGAAICLAFYLFCRTVLSASSVEKKVISSLALIGIVLVLLFFSSEIVSLIANISSVLGIDTYTIRRLLDGTWLASDSRDVLFSHYFDLVLSRPMSGYGLYGAWVEGGMGPHNALLTLLLAFGLVIGGILCLLFIASFVRAVVIAKDSSSKTILCLCFCSACFTELLTAGLNITTPILFIFLLFCWGQERSNKVERAIG